jgi:hypothetical protein
MGGMQEKYLAEFEKYKHIVIVPGVYKIKDTIFKCRVVSVDESGNKVEIENDKGNKFSKTLHWARKNLVRID